MVREHVFICRVLFSLRMAACTWVESLVIIRVMFAAVSVRAYSCTFSSRVAVK